MIFFTNVAQRIREWWRGEPMLAELGKWLNIRRGA